MSLFTFLYAKHVHCLDGSQGGGISQSAATFRSISKKIRKNKKVPLQRIIDARAEMV